MRTLAVSFLLSFLGALSVSAADSKINKGAQELSKLLAPNGPAAKANPADFDNLRKRMTTIIEKLEASARGNGAGPESLIVKAYEMRDDVASVERLMTGNAIINAWREASGRGLFDENGGFTGKVTKGRGTGQECVFELIVPAEAYPPASNQLANLRLVPLETKRSDPTKLSSREESYQGELAGLIAEKSRNQLMQKQENPERTNQLGMTDKESAKRWEQEMAAAGEKAKETPSIRVAGRLMATPSHQSGQRWQVNVSVGNGSGHPTEITLEVYLIGRTWKKGDYYVMMKSSQPLKMVTSETRTLEFFSKTESSYKARADQHDQLSKAEIKESSVRYRGYVIIARHGDKVVAYEGSDQRLAEFGNPATEGSPLAGLKEF